MLAANLVPRAGLWVPGELPAPLLPAGLWCPSSRRAGQHGAGSQHGTMGRSHAAGRPQAASCCRPAHAARPPLGAGQGHPTSPQSLLSRCFPTHVPVLRPALPVWCGLGTCRLNTAVGRPRGEFWLFPSLLSAPYPVADQLNSR